MKSSANELFHLALKNRFPVNNIEIRNGLAENQNVEFSIRDKEKIYIWFWMHGDVSLFHYDGDLLLESYSDLAELTAEEILEKVAALGEVLRSTIHG